MKAGTMRFKLTPRKAEASIVEEWDALSLKRFQQITSGSDLTYNHVLLPEIMKLIGSYKYRDILDAGCGTGILSRLLSEKCERITGVDPSGKSIEIARSINNNRATFFAETIEQFSEHASEKFDVVFANMVLMDTLDLDGFLRSVTHVLANKGVFIFSITHPMFWPIYFGYENERWFDYPSEIVIEAPFRTSLDPSGDLVSTHVHRPLTVYFDALKRHGLILDQISEPMPSLELEMMYPKRWKFPHYFLARCKVSR